MICESSKLLPYLLTFRCDGEELVHFPKFLVEWLAEQLVMGTAVNVSRLTTR